MKVLFLHGYGSDPNGIRPTFLEQSGHEVIHPALPDEDFPESVRIAQAAYDGGRPEVIVGSSRGGAVALHLAAGNTPLVLIAPAWRKWAPTAKVSPSTIILHSEHDEVVPIDGSRELLERSEVPADRLVVVGDNHKMTDPAAFDALLAAIDRTAQDSG